MSDLKTKFSALKGKKTPYLCPVEHCEKILKSFTGAKIHLYKFHNQQAKQLKGTHYSDHAKNNVIVNSNETINHTDINDTFEVLLEGQLCLLHINDRIAFVDNSDIIEEETYSDILQSEKASCAITSDKPTDSHYESRKFSGNLSVGVLESSYRIIRTYVSSSMPGRPSTYYKFNEDKLEDINKEVEYDMDDEDAAWLSIMNERRKAAGFSEVNEDIFELLMDRLEKESYFHCQSNVDETLACIDENAVCCICNDGECDDSNAIIFCDQCDLPVHQECYGVPFIPEGQWLCRKCTFSPSFPVNCVLCPNKDGAFKQTDDGRWAHVICALWIPEVGFKNPNFLEPIDSLQNIPRARWKLCCYICKGKNVGACIQCKKTSCYTAFHVTCAQNEGLFMEMKAVKANGNGDAAYDITKSAFCQFHTPESSSVKDFGSEDSENSCDKIDGSKGMQTLTELNVPVTCIPNISPKMLMKAVESFNIHLDQNFIQRVLEYWKLKRRSKGGAPLLRRLQVTVYQKSKQESKSVLGIPDIHHLIKMRQDFERIRLLLEMIRKREKLKKKLIQIDSQIRRLKLRPFNVCLLKTLDLLQQIDIHDVFAQPVNVAFVPDYLDFIKHPMDFSTMKKKIQSNKYCSLCEFEEDFKLMLNNCLLYNAKDTIYHKIALKMKEKCGPILNAATENVIWNKINPHGGFWLEEFNDMTFNSEQKEDVKKVPQSSLETTEFNELMNKHSKNEKSRETFHPIPAENSTCEVSVTLTDISALGLKPNEFCEENGICSATFNCSNSRNSVIIETMKKQYKKYKRYKKPVTLKTSNRCLRSSVNQLHISSTEIKVPEKLSITSPCLSSTYNWSNPRKVSQFSINTTLPTSKNGLVQNEDFQKSIEIMITSVDASHFVGDG